MERRKGEGASAGRRAAHTAPRTHPPPHIHPPHPHPHPRSLSLSLAAPPPRSLLLTFRARDLVAAPHLKHVRKPGAQPHKIAVPQQGLTGFEVGRNDQAAQRRAHLLDLGDHPARLAPPGQDVDAVGVLGDGERGGEQGERAAFFRRQAQRDGAGTAGEGGGGGGSGGGRRGHGRGGPVGLLGCRRGRPAAAGGPPATAGPLGPILAAALAVAAVAAAGTTPPTTAAPAQVSRGQRPLGPLRVRDGQGRKSGRLLGGGGQAVGQGGRGGDSRGSRRLAGAARRGGRRRARGHQRVARGRRRGSRLRIPRRRPLAHLVLEDSQAGVGVCGGALSFHAGFMLGCKGESGCERERGGAWSEGAAGSARNRASLSLSLPAPPSHLPPWRPGPPRRPPWATPPGGPGPRRPARHQASRSGGRLRRRRRRRQSRGAGVPCVGGDL